MYVCMYVRTYVCMSMYICAYILIHRAMIFLTPRLASIYYQCEPSSLCDQHLRKEQSWWSLWCFLFFMHRMAFNRTTICLSLRMGKPGHAAYAQPFQPTREVRHEICNHAYNTRRISYSPPYHRANIDSQPQAVELTTNIPLWLLRSTFHMFVLRLWNARV